MRSREMLLQNRNSLVPASLQLGLDMGGEVSMKSIPDRESQRSRSKSEENETSGSENLENPENVSADELQPKTKKRKRYHRHTAQQIQAMEALFSECPHPDDKQRQELSRRLNLEPRQVKFWFQNRRTQSKTQQERAENSFLRDELAKMHNQLRAAHQRMQSSVCTSCGGPVHGHLNDADLVLENARLKEEIQRMTEVASRYFSGRGFSQYAPQFPALPAPELPENGVPDAEKIALLSGGMLALEELLELSDAPNIFVDVGDISVFNNEDYLARYAKRIFVREPEFKPHATRASGLVTMNAYGIVELLMDPEKWAKTFPRHVAKAMTIEYLATSEALNGTTLLMYADLQILTPFVPTRPLPFVRLCKQTADDTWVVVDYSADGYHGSPVPSQTRCKRMPSGFVIQDITDHVNGPCSKVVIIDHIEYDEMTNHPSSTVPGIGFGARSWLAALQSHFDTANAFHSLSPDRQSLLRFAQQISTAYNSLLWNSSNIDWRPVRGTDVEVRVSTRHNAIEGYILSTAALFRLPVPPLRVFDYIREHYLPSEYSSTSEFTRLVKSEVPSNDVVVFRVERDKPMFFVQDACWDANGGTIVHAGIDLEAFTNMMHAAGQGQFTSVIPSGFTVVPDSERGVESGCLVSITSQMLLGQVPQSEEALMPTVSVLCSGLRTSVKKMKNALET